MNAENSPLSTILVVDDHPTNLSVLVELLREDGFKVLVATSGEVALQQLQLNTPDMILLDVMMPGIDGFETCRRLKANTQTQDIPVIFMTALSETVDKLEGFEVGAVDYITKPIDNEEVLARVKTHLAIHNLRKSLQTQNAPLHKEFSDGKQLENRFRESLELLEALKKNIEGLWQEYQALGSSADTNLAPSPDPQPAVAEKPPTAKTPTPAVRNTPWQQLIQGKIDLETARHRLVNKAGYVDLNALDPEVHLRFTKQFQLGEYLPAFIPLLLWQGCYYLGSPIDIPIGEVRKLSDLIRFKIKIVPIAPQSYQEWLSRGFGRSTK